MRQKWNALFCACILGREDIPARLLHCNLVSACDADGNTALHLHGVRKRGYLELLLVKVHSFRLKVRV